MSLTRGSTQNLFQNVLVKEHVCRLYHDTPIVHVHVLQALATQQSRNIKDLLIRVYRGAALVPLQCISQYLSALVVNSYLHLTTCIAAIIDTLQTE